MATHTPNFQNSQPKMMYVFIAQSKLKFSEYDVSIVIQIFRQASGRDIILWAMFLAKKSRV